MKAGQVVFKFQLMSYCLLTIRLTIYAQDASICWQLLSYSQVLGVDLCIWARNLLHDLHN